MWLEGWGNEGMASVVEGAASVDRVVEGEDG